MQSRRDLVHAHQFSSRRLVSALTMGEPGKGESPFHRAGVGQLLGAIIAVVGCIGFAVFGLISPASSSTSWRQPGAIVLESGTASRFVYLGGELRPVVNYASALLAASGTGDGTPDIQTVSAAGLAPVPDGPAIGIPGAPEALPAPASLLAAKWALCLDPVRPGATVVDLAPGTPAEVPPDDRLLAAGPGGEYVVWDNVKFPLSSKAVLIVLGFGDVTPTQVSGPWLDALPTGPALTAAGVPGEGDPGPSITGAGSRVGDLFVASAEGVTQYYELRADGLAPVSRTEFELRAAVPGVPQPVTLSPAQIAAAPASADRSLLTSMPDILGGAVYPPGAQALCVLRGTPEQGQATGAETLVTEGEGVVSGAQLHGGSGAVVPAWGGMLAAPPSASGPASATVASVTTGPGGGPEPGAQQEYLITDAGEKYPIADEQAASALGYGSVTPVTVPAGVLNLIPTGPVLSQAGARESVSWPAG
ncbi:MAG TPA: type VII secretion protein EccB [Trebonia sp.]